MTNVNETYAQRHYESALDYFERGNYEKALQQIDNAIQKSPTNPDYYSTKGVFLHRMNDIARAIEAYESAIRVFPSHTFSHYNLGIIYMKEGKILQAIQQWEEVIRNKPDDVDSIFNIAVALSQLGKVKQAIPFYEKILKLDSSHVMTHQNLGVIYRDERDYPMAKRHFKILKDLDSTYSEIVEKEIFRCEEQEFLDNLEKELKQAIRSIDPSYNNDIGKSLSALIDQDYDKALDFANLVLGSAGNDKIALLAKGQSLAGLGRLEEAMTVFNKAVDLYPNDGEAYFQIGSIFLNEGRYPEALESFEKVKKIDINYPFISENIESIRHKLVMGGQDS